ncbi:MAG: glutathione S-transferase family protein [Bauldia sp.]|nr:glutathione S-transferase family protein [Bauldia sp.]
MTARQTAPIELYYWPTPDGVKAAIMLEELGVPYGIRFVDIGRGDHHAADFMAVSPGGELPAIVDPEGPDRKSISVAGSGPVLRYLARKFDRFYPAEERARTVVDEWLAWQVGSLGPMLAQYGHFTRFAAQHLPYAVKRYAVEAHRLYDVLNRRLEGRAYVAGDYSIADIAIFAWARRLDAQDIDRDEFPNVARWIDRIAARPAVQHALAIEAPRPGGADRQARAFLLGQRAAAGGR